MIKDIFATTKKDPYTQCLLRKENSEQVAWIPAKFASVDRILKIKDDSGNWESGWRVMETYATMDGAYIRAHERDHKKQRKASDI